MAGWSHAANAQLATGLQENSEIRLAKNKPIPGWLEIGAHLDSFNLQSKLIFLCVKHEAATAFGRIDAENA